MEKLNACVREHRAKILLNAKCCLVTNTGISIVKLNQYKCC